MKHKGISQRTQGSSGAFAQHLYRGALILAAGGVASSLWDWTPVLPLSAYFFTSAGLWFLAITAEVFQPAMTRRRGAPERAPRQTPVKHQREPQDEMGRHIFRVQQETENARAQMDRDAERWPMLRREPAFAARGAQRPIRITVEDIEHFPSLLRAAMDEHAATVPTLSPTEPFRSAQKNRYTISADRTSPR